MKSFSQSLLAAALIAAAPAFAQQSAIGLWKTIDDESGKPKSLVRITETNGEFRGKIEKLFRGPTEDQNPKCELCEGANKDQPRIGLTILTGMRLDGSEYSGGQILDPTNGKVYKGKMTLIENGKKLELRGYVGIPLFGRSQTWLREE